MAWSASTCFSGWEDHKDYSSVKPWQWIPDPGLEQRVRAARTWGGGYCQEGLSLLCARAEQSPNDVTSCFVMPLNIQENTWSDSPPACFTIHSNIHFKHFNRPLEVFSVFLLFVVVNFTLQFEVSPRVQSGHLSISASTLPSSVVTNLYTVSVAQF